MMMIIFTIVIYSLLSLPGFYVLHIWGVFKDISQATTASSGLSLENILLKTMFDLPGQENVDEIIIDLGAAKGQNDPLIIHTKEVKSKTEKTSAA